MLLLLIPLIVTGIWLMAQAKARFAVITESPSEEAEMAVPPTPQVLSDNDGYVEEAFVTKPTAFSYSDPERFRFRTYLMVAGEDVEVFDRATILRYPTAEAYTDLLGVSTYRGTNYRGSATYGTARINEKLMSILWTHNLPDFPLSSHQDGTAQPLIIQWPADVMNTMTFKTAKKDKLQLTEVIFADKSGTIFFLDLDDGQYSRTPLPTIAYTEGTPTLDPRGIPLLFVGQSVQEDGDVTRSRYQYLYVYDLIKNKRVYRFGSSSIEPFSNNEWQGYTGSPLVYDDRVVIMGESGILYTFALDAEFDIDAGDIYIDDEPNLAKYKYENEATGYFVTDDDEAEKETAVIQNGTTGSLAGYKDYVFFSDRSGFLQCVNINNLSLVYAVDLKGLGDVTVNIEDEGEDSDDFYIYAGTRLGYSNGGETAGETNTVYFRKIEGLTGKVLWENAYEVAPNEDYRAGLAETALIGEGSLSRYIYYAVINEQNGGNTTVVCANKSDGEVVWEYQIFAGCKSVPTAMYDKSGKGYVIMGDIAGHLYFLDGDTGGIISRLILESGIDGCPAVFNNKIVVHLNNDTLVCVKVE
ncbi:MAG: PQQ-binding-like beta-propeller repeat protein [Eubacteriales bacterium]